MTSCATLLAALGGESGCKRLSAEFYARVATDPVLHHLFPGKTLKCATEEFAAFLIQFLGGDEARSQRRWWLSLRESHARFRIGPAERLAWLKNMDATLDASALDDGTRMALRRFFRESSSYVSNDGSLVRNEDVEHVELVTRWSEQRLLDDVIAAIASARDEEAIASAPRFQSRPSVYVGLLARMVRTGRAGLIGFVHQALELDGYLITRRFAGRTLLHYAAAAGRPEIVTALLRLGTDPNVGDGGGHTPLYSVANECDSPAGGAIVRALVEAGADVNACGVSRVTALHMAARRENVEIARALLDCGAVMEARDAKGATPLQRAVNCRQRNVARFLQERADEN